MTQQILRNLLIHTCTISQAQRSDGSAGTYGHDDTDYEEPEAVAEKVPCLLQALSVQELSRLGMDATLRGVYSLFVLPIDMPDSLTMSAGAADHQISDVRAKRGNKLIDAGPFNITSVIDEAGQGHHYRLTLLRVS